MKKILLITTCFFPLVSFAATPNDFPSLIQFIIDDLISPLVLLVASVAFLAFLWGIARYIFSAGDENKKEYGRYIMVYGVIALFVMVSVWGLVQILKNTFFEGSGTPVDINTDNSNPSPGPSLPPPIDPSLPGPPPPTPF